MARLPRDGNRLHWGCLCHFVILLYWGAGSLRISTIESNCLSSWNHLRASCRLFGGIGPLGCVSKLQGMSYDVKRVSQACLCLSSWLLEFVGEALL